MNLVKVAAFVIGLVAGNVTGCLAASAETSGSIVDFETPLSKPQPLQGYLRQPAGAGPWPAVVLLHGCSGRVAGLDRRWGQRIAAWGYVALTVDSFGPRGLSNTCNNGAPVDLAFDAYRALGYLVQQQFVDPGTASPCSGSRRARDRRCRPSNAASSNWSRRTSSAPRSPSTRTASD